MGSCFRERGKEGRLFLRERVSVSWRTRKQSREEEEQRRRRSWEFSLALEEERVLEDEHTLLGEETSR